MSTWSPASVSCLSWTQAIWGSRGLTMATAHQSNGPLGIHPEHQELTGEQLTSDY